VAVKKGGVEWRSDRGWEEKTLGVIIFFYTGVLSRGGEAFPRNGTGPIGLSRHVNVGKTSQTAALVRLSARHGSCHVLLPKIATTPFLSYDGWKKKGLQPPTLRHCTGV
jgi:hypothetical protein